MRPPPRPDPDAAPDAEPGQPPARPGFVPLPEPEPTAPPPQGVLATLHAQAIDWCRDRSWEVRVPVLLFFAYVLFRHLTALEYGNFFFNGINLGIHEMGHIVFRPFGWFLMIAGGTILQILVPLIAAGAFYLQQRDFFAVAFCFGWLSTSCFNCAIYASDARGQLNLVLVSPWGQGFGADGIGDWSRMLSHLGLLHWDARIAFAWKALGVLSMLVCFALSGWLFWQMQRLRGEPPPPPPSWA